MLTKTKTIPMEWLWEIAQEYRDWLKNSSFYRTIALASSAADVQWIRQLYHLSCDFTAATAIRYGKCEDPLFRDVFAEHAAEEIEHPRELANWMREFGFLAPGEAPTKVPPTLETLALGSYFIRAVIREPIAHQIITLNLIAEGIAIDFYRRVNPKLAELGLTPKGYWLVHQEADTEHQTLGLDLISQCERDSPLGQKYSITAWEVASLWNQVFDSWNSLSMSKQGSNSPYRKTKAEVK